MADPMLLLTLEREARRLASDVDSVVENLACILQSISALTVETVETYRLTRFKGGRQMRNL